MADAPTEPTRLFLKRIWTFLERNRYSMAAAVAIGVLWFWAAGCQSTTPNPFSPTGEQVDRAGLRVAYERAVREHNAAGEAISDSYELATADLDQQDEVKVAFVDLAKQVAGPALGPYAVGVSGILAALGIGLDNRRKDKVIDRKRVEVLEAKNGVS